MFRKKRPDHTAPLINPVAGWILFPIHLLMALWWLVFDGTKPKGTW